MARTTLTFTRDSSADIKSSYERDTSNDITTTSVVGEVVVGSTVNYNVEENGEPLYAWESDLGDIVYTKTPTPTVGDIIYDINGGTPPEIISQDNGAYYPSEITETSENNIYTYGYYEPS